MRRSISTYTSDFLRAKHVDAGVDFFFNTTVTDIEDHDNQKKIILNMLVRLEVL